MRKLNRQRLFARVVLKVFSRSQRRTQDRVRQRALPFPGKLDRFEDRGVRGNLQKQKLVKTEPENIAKSSIESRLSQRIDPEIKEWEIPQDAVKQFQGDPAVPGRQFRLR